MRETENIQQIPTSFLMVLTTYTGLSVQLPQNIEKMAFQLHKIAKSAPGRLTLYGLHGILLKTF